MKTLYETTDMGIATRFEAAKTQEEREAVIIASVRRLAQAAAHAVYLETLSDSDVDTKQLHKHIDDRLISEIKYVRELYSCFSIRLLDQCEEEMIQSAEQRVGELMLRDLRLGDRTVPYLFRSRIHCNNSNTLARQGLGGRSKRRSVRARPTLTEVSSPARVHKSEKL